MNYHKLYYLTLSLWLLPALTMAQNLVPNPSFEEYKSDTNCLVVQNKEEFASMMVDWTMPTNGTADILSNNYRITCKLHPNPDDQFAIGAQAPHTGNLMIGVFTFAPVDYREYVQVKLVQPLQKGQRYIAGMYVALADSMQLATNNLGMYFSNQAIDLDTFKVIRGDLSVSTSSIITETKKWIFISNNFIALSNATHLLIGNFSDNEETKVTQVRDTTDSFQTLNSSYYFIDDVFVEPLPEIFIPNVFTPNEDGKNETFFIKDLNPESWSMKIYNRWGKQVYFSLAYENNWDGDDLPPGVYFYELRHLRFPYAYKGEVSILKEQI